MTRVAHAWRALGGEQRLAGVAALALLLTMFFPWYGLQSLNPHSHEIYSHDISAFGDVSFVEAAIFLVAAGVLAMLFARGDEREFDLPGGDGTIVMAAGCWAALLIFYRVFSRPAGHGYPVGIEWGFFLAFVAAGALAFAGWRMRAGERPEAPARRTRSRRRPSEDAFAHAPAEDEEETLVRTPRRTPRSEAVLPAGDPRPGSTVAPTRSRPPYPPAPPEQLSFEDPPTRAE